MSGGRWYAFRTEHPPIAPAARDVTAPSLAGIPATLSEQRLLPDLTRTSLSMTSGRSTLGQPNAY